VSLWANPFNSPTRGGPNLVGFFLAL